MVVTCARYRLQSLAVLFMSSIPYMLDDGHYKVQTHDNNHLTLFLQLKVIQLKKLIGRSLIIVINQETGLKSLLVPKSINFQSP